MRQWYDDTLVSIKSVRNGYRVVELPARSTQVYTSKQTFHYEEAEAYISDQYPSALVVPIEDIDEERQRREIYMKEDQEA